MMKHGDSRNSPGYTVVVSPEDEDANLDGSRRHVRPHGVGNEDSGGQPREWTSWTRVGPMVRRGEQVASVLWVYVLGVPAARPQLEEDVSTDASGGGQGPSLRTRRVEYVAQGGDRYA